MTTTPPAAREQLAQIVLADARRLGDLLNSADLSNIEAWMTEVGVELFAAEAGYAKLPPVEDAVASELLESADGYVGANDGKVLFAPGIISALATALRAVMAQRDAAEQRMKAPMTTNERWQPCPDHRGKYSTVRDGCEVCKREAAEHRERVYRKALEFYRDAWWVRRERNPITDTYDETRLPKSHLLDDKGEVARTALAPTTEGETR